MSLASRFPASTLCGFGLMVALALVSGCTGTAPGFYEPIPDSPDFPLSENVIRSYVESDNVKAMRSHAWRVFAAMTQPSRRGMAKFETWYTAEQVFAGRACQAAGQPPTSLHGPFEPDPEIMGERSGLWADSTDKTTSLPPVVVRFDLELCQFIQKNNLSDRTQFQRLMDQGVRDIATLEGQGQASGSSVSRMVAIKTNWLPVAQNANLVIKVWDLRLPYPGAISIGTAPASPGTAFRTVCVAVDKRNCSQYPDAEYHPITDFYYSKVEPNDLGSLKAAIGCSDPARTNACRGDHFYTILTSMHFATREQANWVWATFWWHDHPALGPYAEDRPANVRSPWTNYLMNVSYDMDNPREPDGKPHIAFNPWIEGAIVDGLVSNCMTCHRRAAWSPHEENCFADLASDGSLTVVSSQKLVVVRGARAATSTYFNEPFENQLKMGFLWTLKTRSRPVIPPPVPCELPK